MEVRVFGLAAMRARIHLVASIWRFELDPHGNINNQQPGQHLEINRDKSGVEHTIGEVNGMECSIVRLRELDVEERR